MRRISTQTTWFYVSAICTAMWILIPISGCASQSSTAVTPAASSQNALLERLSTAQHADEMNAQAYRDDSTRGHIYAQKAEELQVLIDHVRAGQFVPQDEVNSALDNSEGSTF